MFHGTITQELINHVEWSHYNENIIEDQKDFVYVKYNGLHLKSMENLQSCISLRVCIFSNNFITDIHPIQNCVKLIKLDLHGNQIKYLPDRTFWSGLKNLKLLYLHDNGIWSLKALDRHVISDEEIIQNWHLPERFKAYNHRLFLNICPALVKGTTYEDETNNIKYIISRINEIMAHNSPVLIIQRWIRGYLVRKELSALFLCKRQHEKKIRELKSKWISITRAQEDKFFKDVISKSVTNIKGKLAHLKHTRYPPVELKYSSEGIKHGFCLPYELKMKNMDEKLKASRHPIQKGQKESAAGMEDEGLGTSFRISVHKLPIYSHRSLKYARALKGLKQDYSPVYDLPLPPTQYKAVTKREPPLEMQKRREFLATQRAGLKLQIFQHIDDHYIEEKEIELAKAKVTAVSVAQVVRERMRLHVQDSRTAKIYSAQEQMERDRETLENKLQQNWKERVNYLEKVKKQRALFLLQKKLKAADRLLVQNLSNELMLLLRGIISIDRVKNKAAILREKHLMIREKVKAEKHQQCLIKEMKKERAEEIRSRHREEKFVMDMMALQKEYERFRCAKVKVAVVRGSFLFTSPQTEIS
uniref:leucine-rich repeat and IQ domain-containing protein 3 isoform X2 n=1 Tax=Jaculus jaculus TaxID=51337 RepID=UPI001E1B2DFE|nr:leucine-rich repeat and IQ domain-containing protein 3 isoform X2 [Jaculus jaculus]